MLQPMHSEVASYVPVALEKPGFGECVDPSGKFQVDQPDLSTKKDNFTHTPKPVYSSTRKACAGVIGNAFQPGVECPKWLACGACAWNRHSARNPLHIRIIFPSHLITRINCASMIIFSAMRHTNDCSLLKNLVYSGSIIVWTTHQVLNSVLYYW